MPDAQDDNVLWVQQTSSVYAADGSVQYPYTSIDDAVNAAAALLPTASNPVGIVVMPGEYEEVVTLDTDYVYLFGWDRDTTILWNASTPLTVTSEDTAVWGLTVRTLGLNPVLDVNTADFNTWVEFNECTFDINDLTDTGASPIEVQGASAARFIDCKIANNYRSNDSFDIHGASQVELWDCEVSGVVNLDQTDDLYIYRSTLDDGKIVSGTTGALFIFETRIVTAVGSAITLDASSQMEIKSCYLESQASNKDIDASTTVTGVVIENNVMMADGIHEDVSHVNPVKYVGSAGNKDFYLTTQEALNACTYDDCVVKLLKDEDPTSYGAMDPPQGIKITIDGNGKHTIARNDPKRFIISPNNHQITFRDLIIEGQFRFVSATAASDIRIENCEVLGNIRFESSLPGTQCTVVDSVIIGEPSEDLYAVTFLDANPECTIIRSRLKGSSGNEAIYWDNGVNNNNLEIAYSTIWHGSGAANNPFGRNAAQTPNWKGAHNAFNVDPDSFGWSTNLVAAGQQQSTFDVNTDY